MTTKYWIALLAFGLFFGMIVGEITNNNRTEEAEALLKLFPENEKLQKHFKIYMITQDKITSGEFIKLQLIAEEGVTNGHHRTKTNN